MVYTATAERVRDATAVIVDNQAKVLFRWGDSDPIGHRARIDRVGIGYSFEATDRGDHDNYTVLPTAHSLRSWVTRGRSGPAGSESFEAGSTMREYQSAHACTSTYCRAGEG